MKITIFSEKESHELDAFEGMANVKAKRVYILGENVIILTEPENQEGKEWHSNGDCSLCSCTDGRCFKPQKKEECKHKAAAIVDNYFMCPECGSCHYTKTQTDFRTT